MHNDSQRSPHEPMFALGQVVATSGALTTVTDLGVSPLDLIHRHVTGDWSDMRADDQHQNLLAIHSGLRIFSSYKLSSSTKIWIITEADRSSTTLLLPDEY